MSWALTSEGRAVTQGAYRVLVASSPQALDTDRGDLWDSGEVRSAESLGIAYGGPVLRSGQRCFWKVRVWDGKDRPSAWSPAASWEMALLKKAVSPRNVLIYKGGNSFERNSSYHRTLSF